MPVMLHRPLFELSLKQAGQTHLLISTPRPSLISRLRPHVRLDEQQRRNIVWPTVGVWSAPLPGSDVIFVLGPEPALRWKTFASQVVGIAEKYSSPLVISLGALLADVPHTRPVHVFGSAADDDLVSRFDLERSRYEGPTGIVGVVQHALTSAGFSGASL